MGRHRERGALGTLPMLRIALAVASLLLFTNVQADVASDEIDYLIEQVATSDCTFIRNGKRYESEAAADHLRMKYRRAGRHARTAEMFIERLASKSSMSGKLYALECAGQPRQETGKWLTARLAEYRLYRESASP